MIVPIFDALKAALPGRPLLLGKKHLAANGAPPRMVVVPGTETFGPGRSNRDAQGRPVKSIATRTIVLNVHVWGADIPQVEAMIAELVLALRGAAGSCRIGTGVWLTQDEASWLVRGEAYQLPIEFDTPITVPATFASLEGLDTVPGTTP